MNEAPDGMYLVKDGVTYQVTPRIKIPLAKMVNLMTGEVTYPTNADRIRAMSDKELKEFLFSHDFCYKPFQEEIFCEDECKPCLAEWLKAEASE